MFYGLKEQARILLVGSSLNLETGSNEEIYSWIVFFSPFQMI